MEGKRSNDISSQSTQQIKSTKIYCAREGLYQSCSKNSEVNFFFFFLANLGSYGSKASKSVIYMCMLKRHLYCQIWATWSPNGMC